MIAQTVVIPAGALGRDYAYFRPTPEWLHANKVAFVSRYLAKLPNGKVINGAEIDLLHRAGVAIVLNWEQSAGDPLKGAAVGADHGRRAKQLAESLGYPHELAIVFSVDIGVTDPTLFLRLVSPTKYAAAVAAKTAIEGYLRAAAEAIAPYRFGYYGGTLVLEWVKDICSLGWQANASSWSPKPSEYVHIKQHGQAPDHQTDPNTCIRPFNAWLPHEVSDDTPPTPPTPPQPSQEDDMATAILQIPGRNAQFIGQGTRLPDGSVHCLLVTWYGPGPLDNPFLADHAAAPDTKVQMTSVETLKRDLVLVGCYPQDIDDATYQWSAGDFAHAVNRPT